MRDWPRKRLELAETRREWVRAEKERMKRDREAQWLGRVRGWAWSTKGDFVCAI